MVIALSKMFKQIPNLVFFIIIVQLSYLQEDNSYSKKKTEMIVTFSFLTYLSKKDQASFSYMKAFVICRRRSIHFTQVFYSQTIDPYTCGMS